MTKAKSIFSRDPNGEFIYNGLNAHTSKKYKADTPLDKSFVPYLIMLFCAVVDATVFINLFKLISYDSPAMLGVEVAGFLVAFDGPLVSHVLQTGTTYYNAILLRGPYLFTYHSFAWQHIIKQADTEQSAAILCGPEKERTVCECGNVWTGALRPYGARLPHHLPRGAAKGGGGGADPCESLYRLQAAAEKGGGDAGAYQG